MPKRRTYKKRTSRRRRTVRGGWRFSPWGSAKVAPMPAALPLRPPRTFMNYVLRRPPPPINFSRLSDEQIYSIPDSEFDTMTDEELEAYSANLQRRSNRTAAEVARHVTIVNAAREALGRPLGPEPTEEDMKELDKMFEQAQAQAQAQKR